MKLLNKAFPHPVLRPDTNDFLESAFQAVIEPVVVVEGENQVIEVEIDFFLSNERLREEIAAGRATFAVDISCSDTLYRNVLPCGQNEVLKFAEQQLYGKVEFTGYVICQSSIKDFTAQDLNPEFGDLPFSLQPGDILAFDDPITAFIEFSSLSFESLVRIQTSDEIDSSSYSVAVDGEMVSILMGQNFRSMWDEQRDDMFVAPFLALSVYKDCVLIALQYISHSDEPDNFRWSRALIGKLESLGHQLKPNADLDDLNQLAQELVSDLAVKRILKNAG